ncbi:DUF5677 domain-containing protein [Nesterenkonia halotolerans]|uniref:Uncharacterized protein n=1 Tax=Nesterenkonia halotolerans TaxID=225325 RepID=A0ABR9J347_9MICC|nr:DUF5677 domain-containing protein [Nesterenkonia halotolerans]MBE1513424.1 hypothetical protein [Nesterenkonia halotolerans]
MDTAVNDAFAKVLEEHAARDPEGFSARWEKLTADGTVESLINDASRDTASRVYVALRRATPRLVDGLRGDRQRLEGLMDEVWGPADSAFEASNYLGYELGQDIAGSTREHGPKMKALLGAHGRALRTAGEIRHLAMSGFHAGAVARWRTLHELAVLIQVLGSAGPEVSRRYLDYARVENLQDMENYQLHAEALGRKPFDAEEMERAKRLVAEVVERSDKTMLKPNGWAFPLFPEKKSVTFRDLELLVGLEHLRPFYKLGNNHIHAGPRAGELNLNEGTPSGTSSITVGPTVFGDIAETCHGAMISVHQATAGLVNAYFADNPGSGLDLLVGLMAQARFVEDGGKLWGEAAERARGRGWFTHRPD